MTGTAFPSSITLTRFEIGLNENKLATESLLTRRRQTVTLSAGTSDRWEGLLETAPLDTAGARTMMAWLAAVGEGGTFNIADPMYSGPTSGLTTASVNGGSQTGIALAVDGLTPSTTVALAGEYFQVGDGYHILTADATTNGSGEVTLAFKPAMRASPANNATVTFTGARLTLIMLEVPRKAPDSNRLHVFTIPFVEYMP